MNTINRYDNYYPQDEDFWMDMGWDEEEAWRIARACYCWDEEYYRINWRQRPEIYGDWPSPGIVDARKGVYDTTIS